MLPAASRGAGRGWALGAVAREASAGRRDGPPPCCSSVSRETLPAASRAPAAADIRGRWHARHRRAGATVRVRVAPSVSRETLPAASGAPASAPTRGVVHGSVVARQDRLASRPRAFHVKRWRSGVRAPAGARTPGRWHETSTARRGRPRSFGSGRFTLNGAESATLCARPYCANGRSTGSIVVAVPFGPHRIRTALIHGSSSAGS